MRSLDNKLLTKLNDIGFLVQHKGAQCGQIIWVLIFLASWMCEIQKPRA